MTNQQEVDQEQIMSAIGSVMKFAGGFLPLQEIYLNPYDMIETAKEIKIYIEMPGVPASTIGVDFFNNKLKVTGKKSPYINEELSIFSEPYSIESICMLDSSITVHKSNIKFYNVNITIQLPLAITNKENVKVKLEKGILFICIDKKEESKNSFSIALD